MWRRGFLLVVICAGVVASPSSALAADPTPVTFLAPPVDGAITKGFIEPLTDWGPGHRGIDYAAAPGTQVRAAATGTVSFAGEVAGIGAVTIVHDGGLETTYSQLAEISVERGDIVPTGTWIGVVGAAHTAEPGGLHLGVKLNGDYVDPSGYLGGVDASAAIHLVPVNPEVVDVEDIGFLNAFPDDVKKRLVRKCWPVDQINDSTPPPNDNIVVVVAGIASSTEGSSDDVVFTVPAALGYASQDVYRFSYAGTDGPRFHELYGPEDTWDDIRVEAEKLEDLLRRIRAAHPGRDIDLIAHSQGGVVARYFLTNQLDAFDGSLPRVANLVTFSTPHSGAPLAGVANELEGSLEGKILMRLGSELAERGKVPIDPEGISVAQLAPGSSLMTGMTNQDTVYGTKVLALNLPNDIVVPANHAKFPGKVNVTVPPVGWFGGHSAIVEDLTALSSAYNFLRGGRRECANGWTNYAGPTGWAISTIENTIPKFINGLFPW